MLAPPRLCGTSHPDGYACEKPEGHAAAGGREREHEAAGRRWITVPMTQDQWSEIEQGVVEARPVMDAMLRAAGIRPLRIVVAGDES